MKKKHYILIVIILLILVGGSLLSYYFYSKSNKLTTTTFEEPKPTTSNEELKLEDGSVKLNSYEKYLFEIIPDKKGDELKYKFTLNGKKHTLTFKYKYTKGGEFVNPSDYYHYKVTAEILFNNVNITSKSEYLDELVIFYETYDVVTLSNLKETIQDMSMINEFDIQIIKGSDKKDYLFMSLINKEVSEVQTAYMIILNDKGEVVDEISFNMTSHSGIKMRNKEENMKYNEWGYYFTLNKNGFHEITFLSLEKVYDEDNELIAHDPYKSTLKVSNNKTEINKNKLSLDSIIEYKE